ncbi:hypothetical protein VW23_018405 [Devosia insulae DS-56]|uniref:FAD-binding PCMH-type domain-containing protein n=1 Tax=Devosia insulae DS-56 TaxID=1116389 RepID=A0A1E5XR37_9HYPH|nr:hypothetical protein VW23_018405 [Devosia insulae DS-56]
MSRRLLGPVLRPSDFDFAKFNLPNNLRYADILPTGIALCASTADVVEAIQWCREYSVPFAARSGGHSYAGFSMSRGLTIDVSMMNAPYFDPSTGIVRIGAGARNQILYAQLRAANIAITHGRCPTVGVAGFVLGGGIGFNMRANGLACDQVVESEIVLADGQVLTLDARSNDHTVADLYWACRGGGGGNFGINTAFALQTFAAPPVCAFQCNWSAEPDEMERVFGALMEALDEGPDTLGTRFSVGAITPEQLRRREPMTLELIGQIHHGTRQEVLDLLKPVYAVEQPATEKIEELPYWAGQDFLEEPGTPAPFQERSTFLVKPLDPEGRKIAFDFLRRWPGTGTGPDATADFRFFQTGGRVNKVPADATAFVHRNTRFIEDIGLNWPVGTPAAVLEANFAWQDAFYEAMRPHTNGQAYQNFMDPVLEDWQQAYYGSNLPRLKEIKHRVDPDNLFRFAQSIPPA